MNDGRKGCLEETHDDIWSVGGSNDCDTDEFLHAVHLIEQACQDALVRTSARVRGRAGCRKRIDLILEEGVREKGSTP